MPYCYTWFCKSLCLFVGRWFLQVLNRRFVSYFDLLPCALGWVLVCVRVYLPLSIYHVWKPFNSRNRCALPALYSALKKIVPKNVIPVVLVLWLSTSLKLVGKYFMSPVSMKDIIKGHLNSTHAFSALLKHLHHQLCQTCSCLIYFSDNTQIWNNR